MPKSKAKPLAARATFNLVEALLLPGPNAAVHGGPAQQARFFVVIAHHCELLVLRALHFSAQG